MGFSAEEKGKRERRIRELGIRYTVPSERKPYVFLSYKSDDWQEVMEQIAAPMQKRYGLRMYFDAAFDYESNENWIRQMQENMDNIYCQGIVCCVSKAYMTSYATLCELLHSQSTIVYRRHNNQKLPITVVFLPSVGDKRWNDLNKEIQEGDYGDFTSSDDRVSMETYELAFFKKKLEDILNPKNGADSVWKEEAETLSDFDEKSLTKKDISSSFVALLSVCQITQQYQNEAETFWDKLYGKLSKLSKENGYELFDSELKEKPAETKPEKKKPEEKKTEEKKPEEKKTKASITPVEAKRKIRKETQVEVGKEPKPTEEGHGEKDEKWAAFEPEKVEAVTKTKDGDISLREIRRRMETDLAFCERLGQARRTELPYGGKSYMDYVMAAVLSGCNHVKQDYQWNYYNYCVADMSKKREGAKNVATWTWSSNARKVVGYVGAGQMDKEINSFWEELPDTTTVNQLITCFEQFDGKAFTTKKNQLAITGLQKLLEIYHKG